MVEIEEGLPRGEYFGLTSEIMEANPSAWRARDSGWCGCFQITPRERFFVLSRLDQAERQAREQAKRLPALEVYRRHAIKSC